MNGINSKNQSDSTNIIKGEEHYKKHYNRFKGFITYDLEERPIEDKQEILKAIIKVAKDMLNDIEKQR